MPFNPFGSTPKAPKAPKMPKKEMPSATKVDMPNKPKSIAPKPPKLSATGIPKELQPPNQRTKRGYLSPGPNGAVPSRASKPPKHPKARASKKIPVAPAPVPTLDASMGLPPGI
jgi:hypothetical protein